jgi:hypothetical protein
MNEKINNPPPMNKDQMLNLYKEAMKTAPTPQIKQDLEKECCKLEESMDVTESSLHNTQDIDVPPLKNK